MALSANHARKGRRGVGSESSRRVGARSHGRALDEKSPFPVVRRPFSLRLRLPSSARRDTSRSSAALSGEPAKTRRCWLTESGLGRRTRNPRLRVHGLPDAQVKADLASGLGVIGSVRSPDSDRVGTKLLHGKAGTLEVPAQIAQESGRVDSYSHSRRSPLIQSAIALSLTTPQRGATKAHSAVHRTRAS